MKKLLNKKIVLVSMLFIIFLLFFKIDFRFAEGIYCCGDDYDYFSHAQTLAEDFDLDYTNQLKGYEETRFNLNGKIAPKGFFGSGLLASPFLFLGNYIDGIVKSYFTESYSNFMNYGLLLYSLSSIFYMFLTIELLKRILQNIDINIKKLEILLLYASSGVFYYAFERFSMSHIYETFTITLVIFFTVEYFKNSKKLSAFLVPLCMLLALLVRLVNYYVLIIPLIVRIIFFNKTAKNIYTNNYFVYSSILSILLYSYLSHEIYGIVSINPETLYSANGVLNSFVQDIELIPFFFSNLKNLFIVLFGQEFGILWFSPIIFWGLVSAILPNKRENIFEKTILLIPFIMCFASVLLWRSAASSYGFRYLSSLVPVSIVYFYSNKNSKNFPIMRKVLIFLSLFSILGVLFFETTVLTQLSTTNELNSFGRNIKYVEPYYLKGVVLSFIELESYLKIFLTSFLGVFIFKVIFSTLGYDSLIHVLERLNLPIQNEDFVNYLVEIQKVSYLKILLVLLIFFYISKSYIVDLKKE
jgi:hypothetical protein|tara:strand:+ start:1074 stop:2654 length:1581 start_codon:yes stop_codon:yes gene_type:complete